MQLSRNKYQSVCCTYLSCHSKLRSVESLCKEVCLTTEADFLTSETKKKKCRGEILSLVKSYHNSEKCGLENSISIPASSVFKPVPSCSNYTEVNPLQESKELKLLRISHIKLKKQLILIT